jgi:acetolactate synthase I/II/III large subunit
MPDAEVVATDLGTPSDTALPVTEAVAEVLTRLGADTVFGVVGSGNFKVTNALIARGARYVAARHEGGAAVMADAWARLTGRPGLVSVHQGPGLTNAMTGITEAAKSRTPMVVLAADVASAAVRSNFRIDVAALARSVDATAFRPRSPGFAVSETVRAYRVALTERRTVVLALPLDVQAGACTMPPIEPVAPRQAAAAPAAAAGSLADALARARRPVFIAGRGARVAGARADLERLADRCGALLATSAAAKGLFRGSPWDLDVSGGFASPLAAELIREADLIVGWGCSLNMWTLRHGNLIGPEATVAQVDDDPSALGGHVPVALGVTGDVALTARAVADALAGASGGGPGYRSDALRDRIAAQVRWRDVPYEDEGTGDRIDPRTLSIGLDDVLPPERIVAVDSGNFMGYPSMYLSVPDADGFCFTQAYQSIGLGLASAIGSAIVVYDDDAYGAEVHHFGPDGDPVDTVRFPPVKIARIGRGFGCQSVTVRRPRDLRAVKTWLDGPRDAPLLVHAKVTSEHGSWWLEEAFRGH